MSELLQRRFETDTLKRVAHQLPKEVRDLRVHGAYYNAYPLWHRCNEEIKLLLPHLTGLYLDFFAFFDYCRDVEDDAKAMLGCVVNCTSLRKLTLSFPAHWFIELPKFLDDIVEIICKPTVETEITLILKETNVDSDEDETVAPMAHKHDKFISLLLRNLSKYSSRVNGLPTIQKICLKNYKCPPYDVLRGLRSLIPTVELSDVAYPDICESNHLCELWNIKCKLKCKPCSNSILRKVSLACHRLHVPINATFSGTKLVDLSLIDNDTKRNSVDITSDVVTMLDLQSLRRLRVRSYNKIKIDLFRLGQALKRNECLEWLELDGIDFQGLNGRSLLDHFLMILKESRKKTLSVLSIGTDLTYHFISKGEAEVGPCRWSFEGTTYHCEAKLASRIQYMLWLNKYGRERLRSGSGTIGFLFCQLAEICPLSHQAVNRNTELKVLHSAEYEHNQAITSVIYGLLREAPHIWSDKASNKHLSTERGTKRKLRELEASPANGTV